jgi:hypothetical protein
VTRAEKIRLMLAHTAAAKALRAELEAAARHEHDHEHVRVKWDVPGIAAFATQAHDHAEVADPDAFFTYLEKRFPTEIITRTVREVRNQRWLSDLLEAWVKRGPAPRRPSALPDEPPGVLDEDGSLIPGLKWVAGGAFKSLTVKPDGAVSRRLDQAARRYALGDAGLADIQRAALEARHLDDEE